jgi:hypothetical protein
VKAKSQKLHYCSSFVRKGGRDEERGQGKRTHISINNVITNVIKELRV